MAASGSASGDAESHAWDSARNTPECQRCMSITGGDFQQYVEYVGSGCKSGVSTWAKRIYGGHVERIAPWQVTADGLALQQPRAEPSGGRPPASAAPSASVAAPAEIDAAEFVLPFEAMAYVISAAAVELYTRKKADAGAHDGRLNPEQVWKLLKAEGRLASYGPSCCSLQLVEFVLLGTDRAYRLERPEAGRACLSFALSTAAYWGDVLRNAGCEAFMDEPYLPPRWIRVPCPLGQLPKFFDGTWAAVVVRNEHAPEVLHGDVHMYQGQLTSSKPTFRGGENGDGMVVHQYVCVREAAPDGSMPVAGVRPGVGVGCPYRVTVEISVGQAVPYALITRHGAHCDNCKLADNNKLLAVCHVADTAIEKNMNRGPLPVWTIVQTDVAEYLVQHRKEIARLCATGAMPQHRIDVYSSLGVITSSSVDPQMSSRTARAKGAGSRAVSPQTVLQVRQASRVINNYCLCGMTEFTSNGDWVQCENKASCDQSPDGWFHMRCVGLRRVPAGAWECDGCRTGASPVLSVMYGQAAAAEASATGPLSRVMPGTMLGQLVDRARGLLPAAGRTQPAASATSLAAHEEDAASGAAAAAAGAVDGTPGDNLLSLLAAVNSRCAAASVSSSATDGFDAASGLAPCVARDYPADPSELAVTVQLALNLGSASRPPRLPSTTAQHRLRAEAVSQRLIESAKDASRPPAHVAAVQHADARVLRYVSEPALVILAKLADLNDEAHPLPPVRLAEWHELMGQLMAALLPFCQAKDFQTAEGDGAGDQDGGVPGVGVVYLIGIALPAATWRKLADAVLTDGRVAAWQPSGGPPQLLPWDMVMLLRAIRPLVQELVAAGKGAELVTAYYLGCESSKRPFTRGSRHGTRGGNPGLFQLWSRQSGGGTCCPAGPVVVSRRLVAVVPLTNMAAGTGGYGSPAAQLEGLVGAAIGCSSSFRPVFMTSPGGELGRLLGPQVRPGAPSLPPIASKHVAEQVKELSRSTLEGMTPESEPNALLRPHFVAAADLRVLAGHPRPSLWEVYRLVCGDVTALGAQLHVPVCDLSMLMDAEAAVAAPVPCRADERGAAAPAAPAAPAATVQLAGRKRQRDSKSLPADDIAAVAPAAVLPAAAANAASAASAAEHAAFDAAFALRSGLSRDTLAALVGPLAANGIVSDSDVASALTGCPRVVSNFRTNVTYKAVANMMNVARRDARGNLRVDSHLVGKLCGEFTTAGWAFPRVVSQPDGTIEKLDCLIISKAMQDMLRSLPDDAMFEVAAVDSTFSLTSFGLDTFFIVLIHPVTASAMLAGVFLHLAGHGTEGGIKTEAMEFMWKTWRVDFGLPMPRVVFYDKDSASFTSTLREFQRDLDSTSGAEEWATAMSALAAAQTEAAPSAAAVAAAAAYAEALAKGDPGADRVLQEAASELPAVSADVLTRAEQLFQPALLLLAPNIVPALSALAARELEAGRAATRGAATWEGAEAAWFPARSLLPVVACEGPLAVVFRRFASRSVRLCWFHADKAISHAVWTNGLVPRDDREVWKADIHPGIAAMFHASGLEEQWRQFRLKWGDKYPPLVEYLHKNWISHWAMTWSGEGRLHQSLLCINTTNAVELLNNNVKNKMLEGRKLTDMVNVLRVIVGLPSEISTSRAIGCIMFKQLSDLRDALSNETSMPARKGLDLLRGNVDDIVNAPDAVVRTSSLERGVYRVAGALTRRALRAAAGSADAPAAAADGSGVLADTAAVMGGAVVVADDSAGGMGDGAAGGMGDGAAGGMDDGAAGDGGKPTCLPLPWYRVDLLGGHSDCPCVLGLCKHVLAARLVHVRGGHPRLWHDREEWLYGGAPKGLQVYDPLKAYNACVEEARSRALAILTPDAAEAALAVLFRGLGVALEAVCELGSGGTDFLGPERREDEDDGAYVRRLDELRRMVESATGHLRTAKNLISQIGGAAPIVSRGGPKEAAALTRHDVTERRAKEARLHGPSSMPRPSARAPDGTTTLHLPVLRRGHGGRAGDVDDAMTGASAFAAYAPAGVSESKGDDDDS